MLNLSLKELELKARHIKGYKSMPIDKLLSILDKSEQVKKLSEKKVIRDMRIEDFSSNKMLKSMRNLFSLEKDKGINDKVLRDIRTLYESDKENYYKPININNAFNDNSIEYESNGDKDKTLSIKKYLDMIKPYLSTMINNHQNKGEWKIQLTIDVNFISSKDDSNEIHTMHVKSNNVEFMLGSESDEIIENIFESLLQRYQEGLEESSNGSDLVFDCVDLLYYKLHKISLNRSGSYTDSPKWLKNKKATINQKKNDDKCFQYAINVALNYEEIGINPEKITKIKPFIDQYD